MLHNLKASVLYGGRWTKLKPVTNTVAKQLPPVANRPIVYYLPDQIKKAGISDIGIIISPETGTCIKEAVGDGSRGNAKTNYILQPESARLARAFKTAQDFLQDSPFLMFLGDNLIEGGFSRFVREFADSPCSYLVLLKEVEDPRLFNVAEVSASGKMIRLLEKPNEPRTDLALVGAYFPFLSGIAYLGQTNG